MERKPRKPRNEAGEDGVSPIGTRPAPRNRPVSRPPQNDEARLETYEQPAARGGGDDARSQPGNMEPPVGGRRTARDEP